MRDSIGGFFELEIAKNKSLHKEALALNSGRNALEYLIRVKGVKKIYLPCYICDAVLQVLEKCKVQYEFYAIDEQLNPLLYDLKLKEKEFFLYVNYFGIKGETTKQISSHLDNVIIDNTQAFFEKPLNNIDTFYSPRKFLGVVDGGYLYTDAKITLNLPKEKSYNRMEYILKPLDEGIESAYGLFKQNEKYLDACGLKEMSNLTKSILNGIDYGAIYKRRKANFKFIHEQLGFYNKLSIDVQSITSPMVYPLWISNGKNIKKKLIEKNIFVATYWNEVIKRTEPSSIEYSLAEDLIPLPIDQRYTLKNMKDVVKKFSNIIKEV